MSAARNSPSRRAAGAPRTRISVAGRSAEGSADDAPSRAVLCGGTGDVSAAPGSAGRGGVECPTRSFGWVCGVSALAVPTGVGLSAPRAVPGVDVAGWPAWANAFEHGKTAKTTIRRRKIRREHLISGPRPPNLSSSAGLFIDVAARMLGTCQRPLLARFWWRQRWWGRPAVVMRASACFPWIRVARHAIPGDVSILVRGGHGL